MALHYGFGQYEEPPAAKDFWTKKFQALSERDKKFHVEYLPWILMMVDISLVSKETIPHIVARYCIAAPEMTESIKGWCEESGKDFVEYLQRFTGYSVNVRTISTGEFVTKITKEYRRSLPKLSKKEAEVLPSQDDVLLDEMPQESWPLLVNKKWWDSHRGARAKFEAFFKGGTDAVNNKIHEG